MTSSSLTGSSSFLYLNSSFYVFWHFFRYLPHWAIRLLENDLNLKACGKSMLVKCEHHTVRLMLVKCGVHILKYCIIYFAYGLDIRIHTHTHTHTHAHAHTHTHTHTPAGAKKDHMWLRNRDQSCTVRAETHYTGQIYIIQASYTLDRSGTHSHRSATHYTGQIHSTQAWHITGQTHIT